jgi:hypothetical protein
MSAVFTRITASFCLILLCCLGYFVSQALFSVFGFAGLAINLVIAEFLLSRAKAPFLALLFPECAKFVAKSVAKSDLPDDVACPESPKSTDDCAVSDDESDDDADYTFCPVFDADSDDESDDAESDDESDDDADYTFCPVFDADSDDESDDESDDAEFDDADDYVPDCDSSDETDDEFMFGNEVASEAVAEIVVDVEAQNDTTPIAIFLASLRSFSAMLLRFLLLALLALLISLVIGFALYHLLVYLVFLFVIVCTIFFFTLALDGLCRLFLA